MRLTNSHKNSIYAAAMRPFYHDLAIAAHNFHKALDANEFLPTLLGQTAIDPSKHVKALEGFQNISVRNNTTRASFILYAGRSLHGMHNTNNWLHKHLTNGISMYSALVHPMYYMSDDQLASETNLLGRSRTTAYYKGAVPHSWVNQLYGMDIAEMAKNDPDVPKILRDTFRNQDLSDRDIVIPMLPSLWKSTSHFDNLVKALKTRAAFVMMHSTISNVLEISNTYKQLLEHMPHLHTVIPQSIHQAAENYAEQQKQRKQTKKEKVEFAVPEEVTRALTLKRLQGQL